MENKINASRRSLLKLAGIAVVILPATAFAAQNAGVRAAMKYKDTPEGDKTCLNCLQFVPGKTAKDLGGCKVFAGDTEISPNGYCAVWVKLP
ncbi:high-potential iron-sulfur protein [Propionivibrio sp.]|uniref:high-potential iron-sulfur protein n=1 Tax=Propionivibrio sp. TaxID=2212460 RepID=UPI003BF08EF6